VAANLRPPPPPAQLSNPAHPLATLQQHQYFQLTIAIEFRRKLMLPSLNPLHLVAY